MAGEHSLRYIARQSIVHRMDPISKLIWVLVVATPLFFYREARSGGVMLLLVLTVALIGGRIPLRVIVGSAKLIFGVGILLMLFHFFSAPGVTVATVGPLSITDVGLADGPRFFFRLSVMVLASFLLIWTTDIRDLMVSLTKIGVPYRYAFAVFMSLRFLPLVQEEIAAVQSAHKIRGRATRSSFGHRFRLWQRYLFTILINGLRKAESTAIAIDCRGFGTYPERTYVKEVQSNNAGIFLNLLFLAVAIGLLVLERAA